jgi:hypothetical protein
MGEERPVAVGFWNNSWIWILIIIAIILIFCPGIFGGFCGREYDCK